MIPNLSLKSVCVCLCSYLFVPRKPQDGFYMGFCNDRHFEYEWMIIANNYTGK